MLIWYTLVHVRLAYYIDDYFANIISTSQTVVRYLGVSRKGAVTRASYVLAKILLAD